MPILNIQNRAYFDQRRKQKEQAMKSAIDSASHLYRHYNSPEPVGTMYDAGGVTSTIDSGSLYGGGTNESPYGLGDGAGIFTGGSPGILGDGSDIFRGQLVPGNQTGIVDMIKRNPMSILGMLGL